MKTLGEVFNPYLADKPLADDISSAELFKNLILTVIIAQSQ